MSERGKPATRVQTGAFGRNGSALGGFIARILPTTEPALVSVFLHFCKCRQKHRLIAERLNFVGPLTRTVLDEKDFNKIVTDAVGDNICGPRDHQLAGALDLPGTSDERIGGQQLPGRRMDITYNTCSGARVMFSDVVSNGCKLPEIPSCPNDTHDCQAWLYLLRTAAISSSVAKLPLSASSIPA